MDTNTSILLDELESVVVVVDIQQRLAAAMPEDVRGNVIKQVSLLLTAANTLSIPVTATEQYPKGLGPTEPELMAYLDDATIIEKTNFSCVKADDFIKHIERLDRQQIILVGMESHICILQTALDLKAQGFEVYVVEDAVSSRTKENQRNAIQRMQYAGVIITNVESVIFEWLGDAKHSEFKTLAKLLV
ncbi:MAG: hydrolase [Piscirickettsiaceae bacterium]|nr:hydrolase [Piscirickettsiaceae bacterium]